MKEGLSNSIVVPYETQLVIHTLLSPSPIISIIRHYFWLIHACVACFFHSFVDVLLTPFLVKFRFHERIRDLDI